jgi:hypothetical protein
MQNLSLKQEGVLKLLIEHYRNIHRLYADFLYYQLVLSAGVLLNANPEILPGSGQ